MADVAPRIECARAEDFLAALPDASVSLIVTDPPYHRVKDEAWDRQWKSDDAFLDWMRGLCAQWKRVLKPNGSLYVFASPEMGGRVECVIREIFAVLNHAVWRKPDGSGAEKGARAGLTRSYIYQSERIVFAEHIGAERDEWLNVCDKLRGEVFEPLRAYLDGERLRLGLDRKTCDAATGNQMSGHYFSAVQWTLPTAANYEKLRAAFGGFVRSYDDLRAEHDYLATEYDRRRSDLEHRRRPFAVSSAVPFTDVWSYPFVAAYPGKHPCEKPSAMALDIVRASSRPGDVVLDSFAGSGTFAAAAAALGRVPWTCDMDEHWAEVTRERVRLSAEVGTVVDLRGVRKPGRARKAPEPSAVTPSQRDLFSL